MPITFLSVQGTGGTAVPFARQMSPQYGYSVATSPQDSMRLKRYEEHWRFYSGVQWSFQREDGEPLVTANYCRPIVNKKASFLVGKGMILDTPEALREITLPVLEEVWKYNHQDVYLLEQAVTGGVTGDCFTLVTYQTPSQRELAINPYTEGKVRLRLLMPHQVFPKWNPINHEELLSVRIITEVPVDQFSPEFGGFQPATIGSMGVQQRRRYIEEIYPDQIIEGWEDSQRISRPNDLGEIPLVHWPNEVFPGEYHGLSDLDGVIDLQREYNEKLTDISDIVNYHASPITIMLGAKAKQLEPGPKSLWSGLPADAKVFNLEMNGDLPASHKFLETILHNIFDIAGLPEGALGRMQPISNTSAAALQVQFQPLVEATERKLPLYKKGIEKINYYILRWDQLAKKRTFPVDLCKHCGGRIVETTIDGQDGVKKKTRKCYMIDLQTLDFLKPDDVEITVKRRFSYGVETRKMPYWRFKEEFLKESTSYWDPAPEKDLQEELEEQAEQRRKLQEFQQTDAEQRTDEQREENPADPETGVPKAPPPERPPALPPKELEQEPEAKPEKLPPYDMDIPDEPEEIDVTVRTWNAQTRSFEEQKLGIMKIVPTGCKKPKHVNPYETVVKFKNALPRDREKDANLFAQYQTNGWVSRNWVQSHLDEEINSEEVDKQVADDIPFLLALKGMPDPTAQVAQTPGAQEDTSGFGSNNGAPPPPGPGPGRGNKFAAGDNMAGRTPPTATPGTPGGR